MQHYYDLAKRLDSLREKGILIIGSGNIVHNLRVADMYDMDAEPYEWAIEFDEQVKQALLERNHKELLNCQNMSRADLAFGADTRPLPADDICYRTPGER